MKSMNKLIVIFVNISVTFSILVYAYANIENVNENWAVIISVISVVSLLVQLLSQQKLGFGIYDFVTYFFLFSHVFMFGNIYLLAIAKPEFIAWALIHRYETDLLFKAALFILCYLQTLNLGIIIFTNNNINSLKSEHKIELNDNLMKNTGITIFAISMPFRLIIDIANIMAAQSVGSYYALESKTGISDDIAILFVPSIIFILNSSISKKKKSYITIIFIVYSTLIMVLTGDRRYQFIGIVIIMLNYLYINKFKLYFSKTLIFSFLGIIGLNILTQISEIRQKSLVSISTFFSENLSKLFSFNVIYKVFGEFGLSFMTVVIAFKNINTLNPFKEIIPFQNGFSFWGAVPSILPIGWIFPNHFYKVSIFRRLNEIEGYPVGASLPGELYANFGWLSLVFVFLIGGLIGSYFKFDRMKNSFKRAQYFSMFFILINIVRASFLEITRNVFLVLFVPLFIYYFLKSIQPKSN